MFLLAYSGSYKWPDCKRKTWWKTSEKMILPWIYPSQKCVGSLVANHLLSSPLWHCFGLLLSSFGYQKIIRTDFFIRSMITSQPLQKGFSDSWHASNPGKWLILCFCDFFAAMRFTSTTFLLFLFPTNHQAKPRHHPGDLLQPTTWKGVIVIVITAIPS